MSAPTEVQTSPCRTLLDGVPKEGGWYRQTLSDTVIVFVHGILSDSHEAWLTSNAPCQFWPALVAKDPAFGQPSIYLGGYYSGIDSGTATITDVAGQLFTQLGVAEGSPRIAPIAHRKIVFVAHSLGGIVVRRMLADYAKQFEDHHVSLVLYASPAGGSRYADIASWLEKHYTFTLVRELKTASPALVRTNEDFRSLLAHRQRAGQPMHVMEFFEARFPKEDCFEIFGIAVALTCKFIAGTMEPIVPREHAGYFQRDPLRIPDTDHLTIVKPRGTTSDSHKRLVLSLTSFNAIPAKDVFAPYLGHVTVAGTIPRGQWEADGGIADLAAQVGELCQGPAPANVPSLCPDRIDFPGYATPPRDGDIGFVMLTSNSRSVLGSVDVLLTPFPATAQRDESGRPILSSLAASVRSHQLSPDGKLVVLHTVRYQPMRYRVHAERWKIPAPLHLPTSADAAVDITVPVALEGGELLAQGVSGEARRKLAELTAGVRVGLLEFRERFVEGTNAIYRFLVKPRVGVLKAPAIGD